ncbi:MAG: biotin/lipoyl-containing protein [Anaerolineaceae bacterium]
MDEKYLIRDDEDDVSFEIRRDDGMVQVRRDGAESWKTVQLEKVGDSGLYLLMVDNRPTELYLERRRGGAIVTIGRHIWDYDVERWRPSAGTRKADAGESGTKRLLAPMTGSIVEVRCALGETVVAGQVLLVIESMKMNNELRSPADGMIESVPVAPGQRVTAGALLVAIHREGTLT